ncbi:MAG: LPS translocon maturation chaperone LptM [Steroidobacteraceae bacterium]
MSGRGARGWIAAAGALLVCAGCGFKGPLYLPAANATVVTHPAQTAPSAGQMQAPAARKKSKAPQATQPPLG